MTVVGEEKILASEELSAYLKISKSTLYKFVREGRIPCQKIGQHWCFSKVVIDLSLGEQPIGLGAR